MFIIYKIKLYYIMYLLILIDKFIKKLDVFGYLDYNKYTMQNN